MPHLKAMRCGSFEMKNGALNSSCGLPLTLWTWRAAEHSAKDKAETRPTAKVNTLTVLHDSMQGGLEILVVPTELGRRHRDSTSFSGTNRHRGHTSFIGLKWHRSHTSFTQAKRYRENTLFVGLNRYRDNTSLFGNKRHRDNTSLIGPNRHRSRTSFSGNNWHAQRPHL